MAPVRIGMDQEEGELFPSPERVIDAAAWAAALARYPAALEGLTWDQLSESERVAWRKTVLAAVGVVDKQITSVTVLTKVRHHHSTEELEGLMEVLEREVR